MQGRLPTLQAPVQKIVGDFLEALSLQACNIHYKDKIKKSKTKCYLARRHLILGFEMCINN